MIIERYAKDIKVGDIIRIRDALKLGDVRVHKVEGSVDRRGQPRDGWVHIHWEAPDLKAAGSFDRKGINPVRLVIIS